MVAENLSHVDSRPLASIQGNLEHAHIYVSFSKRQNSYLLTQNLDPARLTPNGARMIQGDDKAEMPLWGTLKPSAGITNP